MTDKSKQELIIKVLEETKLFTQNLLKENDRLRLMVAGLKAGQDTLSETRKKPEDMLGSLEERYEFIVTENNRLQQELEHIKEEITKADSESQDYHTRYSELEQQNEMLANLYVTISRLHSTLKFNEVIEIIKEIIINLVGSESFAIYWFDEPGRQLCFIGGESEIVPPTQTIPIGQNIISKSAQTGEIYISMSETPNQEPMACIPLKSINRVLGVIVIYHLLAHKTAFSQTDFELFSMMADHAANAMVSSMIFAQTHQELNNYLSTNNLLKMIES